MEQGLKRRSLFSLIAFCAASALIAAIALVAVFASITVAFAVAHSRSNPQSETAGGLADAMLASDSSSNAPPSSSSIIFAGVITDDRCGPRHDMGSANSPAECARDCVREGAHYLIISGDKKYALAGRDDLNELAGERVTVAGSLTGNTITIGSITAEK